VTHAQRANGPTSHSGLDEPARDHKKKTAQRKSLPPHPASMPKPRHKKPGRDEPRMLERAALLDKPELKPVVERATQQMRKTLAR